MIFTGPSPLRKLRHAEAGFTLIELMVVVGIAAVCLAAVLMVNPQFICASPLPFMNVPSLLKRRTAEGNDNGAVLPKRSGVSGTPDVNMKYSRPSSLAERSTVVPVTTPLPSISSRAI
jgi:prepilin-type N-terminal cleavage/methylation domain-containing protein